MDSTYLLQLSHAFTRTPACCELLEDAAGRVALTIAMLAEAAATKRAIRAHGTAADHRPAPHPLLLVLGHPGATAKTIQELSGHVSLTTTQRYMHLSPAAKENAIRLLELDLRSAVLHLREDLHQRDGVIVTLDVPPDALSRSGRRSRVQRTHRSSRRGGRESTPRSHARRRRTRGTPPGHSPSPEGRSRDERYLARIDEKRAEVEEMGVTGIPTFVIGDRGVVGCQPYDVLARFAESAGARKRTPTKVS